MARLLILLTLPPAVREQYRAALAARFPELAIDVVDHHSKAGPFIGEADALLTFGPHMKDEVLQGARKLKWVQALGTGVDNLIDLPSLSKDVIITNIRGIHGAPVSEAALMMMLGLARDFALSLRNQDKQIWTRWPAQLLDGKTVGIYGIGAIAEVLAPKCKALGMTVVGFTSAARAVPGFDRMHARGDLIAQAPTLDFLVLLAPYSQETRNAIDARVFARTMKPSAVLSILRVAALSTSRRCLRRWRRAGLLARRLMCSRRSPCRRVIRCGRQRTSSSPRTSAASAMSTRSARW